MSGTYTVIAMPDYGLPASGTLGVVAGTSETISAGGAATAYTALAAGENVYLSFTATANQNLELTLNNVSVPGATYNQFIVYVYNAAGGQVASFWCYSTSPGSSCTQHLWYLAAGTYSVVASPYYGGTLSFNALLSADVAGPTIATGSTASLSLSVGQAERFTFNANAGDTLALNATGITTTPTGQGVTFNVYRPDAGAITTGTPAYTSFHVTATQLVNLANLPVSGTYTVIAMPDYGLPASGTLGVVAGTSETISAGGAATAYTALAAGENVYLSFTATANQNLELTLNNVSVPGATYNQFIVYVYNAAGGQVASFWCYSTSPGSSCTQHLWYLAAGTYSVVASPYYGGTLSFNALLSADVAGPTLTAGTPAAITLAAGQAERVKFSGTINGTATLQLSGVATVPAGQNVYVNVYRPDTGAITTSNNYASTYTTAGPVTLNLPNLPATGTYTVVVYTSYGLPATAQLALVPSPSGSVTTTGSIGNFAASGAGQNVSATFNASQGQNLELTLTQVNAAGATSNGFQVNVTTLTGATVASFSCYAANPGSSCTRSLWNLTAGSYTVTAIPIWGGTISFSAQLNPDLKGPALVANTAATVTLSGGQAERLTFSGTAGTNVQLQLAGVSTVPTGQPITVNVYRPDVGTITTTDEYAQFSATDTNTLSLNNLPVSGTYTVVVTSPYGLAGSAQFTYVP